MTINGSSKVCCPIRMATPPQGRRWPGVSPRVLKFISALPPTRGSRFLVCCRFFYARQVIAIHYSLKDMPQDFATSADGPHATPGAGETGALPPQRVPCPAASPPGCVGPGLPPRSGAEGRAARPSGARRHPQPAGLCLWRRVDGREPSPFATHSTLTDWYILRNCTRAAFSLPCA